MDNVAIVDSFDFQNSEKSYEIEDPNVKKILAADEALNAQYLVDVT